MVTVARKEVTSSWKARGRLLLGLMTHLAGLALLVFVAFGLAEDGSLWVLGRHVEAQVISTWVEEQSGKQGDSRIFHWFIRYRFTTVDGRDITGISRVSATEFAALGSGQPAVIVSGDCDDGSADRAGAILEGPTVDVVYFPPIPTHNRLDESRFLPVLACAYIPLILVGCAGLIAGRNLVRSV